MNQATSWYISKCNWQLTIQGFCAAAENLSFLVISKTQHALLPLAYFNVFFLFQTFSYVALNFPKLMKKKRKICVVYKFSVRA
jgi:hypothetical protein